MERYPQFVFGIVTVFIAAFMLFFIFYNLENVANVCKGSSPPSYCSKLSPNTFGFLVMILIMAGFVLIISITAYILITS